MRFLINKIIYISLFTVLFFFQISCDNPNVAIVEIRHPPLVVELKTINRPKIQSVAFYSKLNKEYLWKVAGYSLNSDRIEYGELPSDWKQIIPKEGRPKSLAKGDKIYVNVGFVKDHSASPSGSSTTWSFEIIDNNSVKNLGEVINYRMPLLGINIDKVKYPPLEFHINKSNIKKLKQVDFYSQANSEYIWRIKIGDTDPDKIKYGVIPMNSKQIVPADAPPRLLKLGETVYLAFTFSYDFPSGERDTTSIRAIEITSEVSARDIELDDYSSAIPQILRRKLE